MRDPQCFLFDEPLSNLDAKLRVEMRAELKQLHMRVMLVQPLGDRMDVGLSTESHRHTVAQIPAHGGMRPGDTVPVFFDLERVHYFEKGELGRSLVQNPATPS